MIEVMEQRLEQKKDTIRKTTRELYDRYKKY